MTSGVVLSAASSDTQVEPDMRSSIRADLRVFFSEFESKFRDLRQARHVSNVSVSAPSVVPGMSSLPRVGAGGEEAINPFPYR